MLPLVVPGCEVDAGTIIVVVTKDFLSLPREVEENKENIIVHELPITGIYDVP